MAGPAEDAAEVQVGMVDAVADPGRGEVTNEVFEIWPQPPRRRDLFLIEWEVALEELVEPFREDVRAEVRNAEALQLRGVRDLAALQLGEAWEHLRPERRWVAEVAQRRTGVRGQEPGALGIEAQDIGDTVRPAAGERRRESVLERLDRLACLGVDDRVAQRDAPDGRPRPRLDQLEGTGRLDRRPDPGFERAEVRQLARAAATAALTPSLTNETSAPSPTNVNPSSRCGLNDGWS